VLTSDREEHNACKIRISSLVRVLASIYSNEARG
jgi:hypothetical protein